MGERKVVNKYFPPDFDPAKIPRIIKFKNQRVKVRMMLPMSIRCNRSGTFIGKGTKFNCGKEEVIGEKYLGIQVFRFYIKCKHCCSEITIKTDPKDADYVVESGATRNFEAESCEVKRDDEEIGDVMKGLEDRRLKSKREIEDYAALNELRSMKSRRASVTVDKLLDDLQHSASPSEKRDETVIRSLFEESRRKLLRRINDEDISIEYDSIPCTEKRRKVEGNLNNNNLQKTNTNMKSSSASRISILKKMPTSEERGNGLQSLCLQYESDGD